MKPLASNSAIQAVIATNVTTTLFRNFDVPLAVGAWVTGPSRAAMAIRGRFASVGETRAATPFGRWVADNKRALRIGAILLPLVVFLLWSSPTVTLVIVLAVLAVVMLLAIEALGRASGPAELGTPTSAT